MTMPVRVATQNARKTLPTGTAAAFAAWQRGDLKSAERACQAALLHDPNDGSATRLLGVIAYRAGRHAEALGLLRGVCVDSEDHSNLGAVLRALGRHAKAEAAYRRAIALDPQIAAAQYNLANLLTEQNRCAEAETAVRSALKCQTDYPAAWNALGILLQRDGKLADASQAFRCATQQAAGWAEAHINLGCALLGLEQRDEAKAAFHQALALEPANALALGNLGALHLRACGPWLQSLHAVPRQRLPRQSIAG